MKKYEVVSFPVLHKSKNAALSTLLTYFEKHRTEGIKVVQVIEYTETMIGMILSQEDEYDVWGDSELKELLKSL